MMEHCLFIIIHFIFSRILLIFLVSGSRWLRNWPISFAQMLSTILLVIIRRNIVLSWLLLFYCFNNLQCFILKLSFGTFSAFCFKTFGWKKVLLPLMTVKSMVESAWAEDMGQFLYHQDLDIRKITWKNKIKNNKQTVFHHL